MTNACHSFLSQHLNLSRLLSSLSSSPSPSLPLHSPPGCTLSRLVLHSMCHEESHKCCASSHTDESNTFSRKKGVQKHKIQSQYWLVCLLLSGSGGAGAVSQATLYIHTYIYIHSLCHSERVGVHPLYTSVTLPYAQYSFSVSFSVLPSVAIAGNCNYFMCVCVCVLYNHF